MMGGELLVESEYGKGSYFYFVIPQEIRGNDRLGEFEKDTARTLWERGFTGRCLRRRGHGFWWWMTIK